MSMRAPLLLGLAAATACGVALAQTPATPERKPGWWEMQITTNGPTPQPMHQTVHMCTDPAVDRVQSPFGVKNGGKCPPAQITRTAAGWSIEATCPVGAMTISTSGTATGDLTSHYRVDLDTHMSPAPSPQLGEVKLSIDARWLGACPADKKPGDIEMTMQGNVAPEAASH